MTENNNLATAVVHEKEGWSIYWLLPILALMIAGWLVYKNLVEGDIEIQVSLDTATGLVEGKTEFKYQGITIGVLDSYELDVKDFKGIVATLKVKRFAEPLLTDATKIWLVKPEVNFSGVTGLEALVSGNYFELLFEEGAPARQFKALSKPPVVPQDDDGLELVLISDQLGSVARGAPVMHRRIEVGEVLDYQFNEDFTKVAIRVFIDAEYRKIVNSETRFWESSGVSFTGDFSGFKVQVDSLASLITGGISLDTPRSESADAVDDGHEFTLYEDFDSAHTGILVYVKFKTAKGLRAGSTEVQYKGVTVGKVVDVKPASQLDGMIATISMDPRSEAALNESMKFWLPKPVVSLTEISGIEGILGAGVIEVDASLSGKPKREFVALDQPPKKDKSVPGLHITLQSDTLKSLDRGTEILYRQIPIGSVQAFELSKDRQSVLLDVFIEPEYEHLVKRNSRFWNAGGIEISGGLDGINVRAASLKTVLAGGIELFTPEHGSKVLAKDGDKYKLYSNYSTAHSEGKRITIHFPSGDGLKVGTSVQFLGVAVGEVKAIELNDALNGIEAEVQLYPAAESLAREKTQFWLVQPELSLVKTANLGTLVTGKYISVLPGTGKPKSTFKGLLHKPVEEKKNQGLNLVLLTDRLGSIKEGVKILYRDVAVGEVTAYGLSEHANQVLIYVNIEAKYAPLVKQNSVFWNTSGIGFDFSLFGGAQLQTSSLESILEGGIAFATPPESIMGDSAQQGARYALYSEPNDKWLQWAPKIPLAQ